MSNTVEKVKSDRLFVFYLSSKLFLSEDGHFYQEPPLGSRIIFSDLPFPSLSENITQVFHGQSAHTLGKSLSAKIADKVGIGKDVQEFVTDVSGAFSTFASVASSVVGYYEAAKKILEFFGALDKEPDKLDIIMNKVEDIYNIVLNAAQQKKLDDIKDRRAQINAARSNLMTYITAQEPDELSRQELLNQLSLVTEACFALLDPQAQYMPHIPAKVHLSIPGDRKWFVPRADISSIAETPSTVTMPPLGAFKVGDNQWDYSYTLLVVLLAVSTRISIMKAYEPEFRSTGRWRMELMWLHDLLKTFTSNMIETIYWTRDRIPTDDISKPMVNGWPVGAMNISTGQELYEPFWRKGIIDSHEVFMSENNLWHQLKVLPKLDIDPSHNPVYPNQKPPLYEYILDPNWPPYVVNVAETLSLANSDRELSWLSLVAASGVFDFLLFVGSVEKLTHDPDYSETVIITSRDENPFFRRGVDFSRILKHPFTHEVRSFNCSPRYIFNKKNIDITTQSEHSLKYYTIEYQFYLESYEDYNNPTKYGSWIDRILLSLDGTNANINAKTFELVSSKDDTSVTKKTAIGIESISIDYKLEGSPGLTKIELSNRPFEGYGNFNNVYFVVEEKISSGKIIRTFVDISMIGHIILAPSEYFEFLEEIQDAWRVFISEVYYHIANTIPILNIEDITKPPPPEHPDWSLIDSDEIENFVKLIQNDYPTIYNRVTRLIAINGNRA